MGTRSGAHETRTPKPRPKNTPATQAPRASRRERPYKVSDAHAKAGASLPIALEQRHTRGVAAVAKRTGRDACAENCLRAALASAANPIAEEKTAVAFAAQMAPGMNHDANRRSATYTG
jgi:hypothetical protein